jgi:NADH pyrophosphatase NudC (nudix superfamily)
MPATSAGWKNFSVFSCKAPTDAGYGRSSFTTVVVVFFVLATASVCQDLMPLGELVDLRMYMVMLINARLCRHSMDLKSLKTWSDENIKLFVRTSRVEELCPNLTTYFHRGSFEKKAPQLPRDGRSSTNAKIPRDDQKELVAMGDTLKDKEHRSGKRCHACGWNMDQVDHKALNCPVANHTQFEHVDPMCLTEEWMASGKGLQFVTHRV